MTSATAFLSHWHKAKCIHASWLAKSLLCACLQHPTARAPWQHPTLFKGRCSKCQSPVSDLPHCLLFPVLLLLRAVLWEAQFSSSTPDSTTFPLPGVLFSVHAHQDSCSEAGAAHMICPLPLPRLGFNPSMEGLSRAQWKTLSIFLPDNYTPGWKTIIAWDSRIHEYFRKKHPENHGWRENKYLNPLEFSLNFYKSSLVLHSFQNCGKRRIQL